MYCRTDRGGPEARANHASTKLDFPFLQQGVPLRHSSFVCRTNFLGSSLNLPSLRVYKSDAVRALFPCSLPQT